PPSPPLRRDASLERGVVGTPPPLVRESDHFFTAAEVERLLAVREKEALSLKRRLHRASKKGESLESSVSELKEEASGLRKAAKEVVVERDALQLRVSELEGSVKRKVNALKTAGQRRERAEENAASEAVQARESARLARATLDEAGRKGQAYGEKLKDAETRLKALALRLEATEAQGAEAQRKAEEELAVRALSQERERACLKGFISAAQEENRSMKVKLDEALRGLQDKQEAERETDKVILELQAWRERVATGDIVEMSPSEAKRLRWSEEQAELLREANANLRSELVESGRLLTEAEHSFATVTAGFGDAGATIADLSASLSRKNKEFVDTESALEASRSEASKLKKRVVSLQLGLSEQQRVVRGRERALDSTQKSMEALVRGRQEEIEAKKREAGKRRAAEHALAKGGGELETLRQRAEKAEERSRELDAHRRVLLEHLAAARREVASVRSHTAVEVSSSPAKGTSAAGGSLARMGGWRESTRSLLERAVSDWSVKKFLRSVGTGDDGVGCRSGAASKKRSGYSSPDSSPSSSSGEHPRNAVVSGGTIGDHTSGTGCRMPRPFEVARVYGVPNGEAKDRTAGWRWDLVKAGCTAEGSEGTGDMVAVLGLDTLGRSLRARGVRGEGARTALSAVARVLHALILTRGLAAQQCAEARTELALAVARLSSRAALVSDTREASRRASTCNRTLVLRLVDAEVRCWRWRLRAARAAAASTGMADEHQVRGEGCLADAPAPSGGGTVGVGTSLSCGKDCVCLIAALRWLWSGFPARCFRATLSSCLCYGHKDVADESEERTSGAYGSQPVLEAGAGYGLRVKSRRRTRIKPRSREAGEVERRLHPGGGVTLDLSEVGLDDATLLSVVRRILRRRTKRTQTWLAGEALNEEQHGAGHDGDCTKGLRRASDAVTLTSLLLRGNNVTDAGAVALVPLVETSACLVEVDLRGNAISTKGERTLRKALKRNPWVCRAVSENICNGDPVKGETSAGGMVLSARRRQDSTPADRARAYAFERIPRSTHKKGDGLASRSMERATQPGSCSSDEQQPGVCGDSADADTGGVGRAPAHGGSVGNTGRGRRGLRLTPSSAEEIAACTPSQVVAPRCRIDLRGCHKRPPPPSPLAAVDDTSAPIGRPLPLRGTESQAGKRLVGVSSAECSGDGPHGRRRKAGVKQIAGHALERLKAASGRDPVRHPAQRMGNIAGPAVLTGSALSRRRPRHGRRRREVSPSGDVDAVCGPDSEVEDIDELESLLSVSRRILSKARGFQGAESPPPKESRAPAGGSFKGHRDAVAKRCEREPPGVLLPARVRKEGRRNISGPESGESGDGPATSSRKRTATFRGVKEIKGPRGLGEESDAADGEGRSGRGRAVRACSLTVTAEACSALGEQPPEEMVPAKSKSNGEPGLPAGKRSCLAGGVAAANTGVGASADECTNEPPLRAYRKSGDGMPREDAGGEQLLLEEEGEPTAADAAEVVDQQDGSGWVYDEATESWYAAGGEEYLTCSGEVTAGKDAGGWKYDEQSATWYQDEMKEQTSCVV
ncbi:unnamed protein product, partial [Scytosiphon promiscuus]